MDKITVHADACASVIAAQVVGKDGMDKAPTPDACKNATGRGIGVNLPSLGPVIPVGSVADRLAAMYIPHVPRPSDAARADCTMEAVSTSGFPPFSEPWRVPLRNVAPPEEKYSDAFAGTPTVRDETFLSGSNCGDVHASMSSLEASCSHPSDLFPATLPRTIGNEGVLPVDTPMISDLRVENPHTFSKKQKRSCVNCIAWKC
jgi:hypothetical protein